MERRINKRINEYLSQFKHNVKSEIIKIIEAVKEEKDTEDSLKGLIQYVCDYEKCELSAADFEKRKRSKNNVPIHEQCVAKKADGSRCTRRKRDGSEFCGTHVKGVPHGQVANNETDADTNANGDGAMTQNQMMVQSSVKKLEVWLEDINGIMHYIDNNYNIYDNEDIIKGVENPRIIHKYEKDYVNGKEFFRIQENASSVI